MSVTSDVRIGATAARPRAVTSAAARVTLLAVVLLAAVAGACATGPDAAADAVREAGPDLTRLLRFMAAMKAALAAGAVAAVLWRLGVAVSAGRLALYGLAAAASAAGPGLIWAMAHVAAGALLLHGGLIGCGLMLWRDPAVAERLQVLVTARRARRPR